MFIVIDQMAGRWVDGVTVEKDFPPVKVWGYHRKDLRGKTLDRAEIVDVAAAIADALDLPYVCEGASILRKAAR